MAGKNLREGTALAPATANPTVAPAAMIGAGRVLAIIEAVAGAARPVAVRDLAEELALPKATVHRLVGALEDRGYVARGTDRKAVTVGPQLRALALSTLRAALVRAPSRIILRSLSLELGETCNIGILDGGDVVYLDRVEVENSPLRLQFGIGSRIPIHCTAIGKLFLSEMPDPVLDRLLSSLPLPRLTHRTLGDAAALRREIEQIRVSGFSTDNEEYITGVFCVAVPIRDDAGRLMAVLAVQAPKARLSPGNFASHLPSLNRAAAALSLALRGNAEAPGDHAAAAGGTGAAGAGNRFNA
ncbi:MAG TPA: IclR family transcriptional regulator [Azospirillaceae bacterium]|nr:IclR family transcriptional regulator [Azospirillaceae bacterium]